MTSAPDTPDDLSLRPLEAVLAWQRGEWPRSAVVRLFSRLPEDQGAQVQRVVQALSLGAAANPAPQNEQQNEPRDAGSWRQELMASRGKAWAVPHPAGLLVSPDSLLLTDGQQGVLLREGGHLRVLPGSVCPSLLLLAQTIVMAQNAVDAQELRELQAQRVNSTSTSLSEITPVE